MAEVLAHSPGHSELQLLIDQQLRPRVLVKDPSTAESGRGDGCLFALYTAMAHQ